MDATTRTVPRGHEVNEIKNRKEKEMERAKEDMKIRMISIDEYDGAVSAALVKMASDEHLEGVASFVAPMCGMIFAHKLREILFPENGEAK